MHLWRKKKKKKENKDKTTWRLVGVHIATVGRGEYACKKKIKNDRDEFHKFADSRLNNAQRIFYASSSCSSSLSLRLRHSTLQIFFPSSFSFAFSRARRTRPGYLTCIPIGAGLPVEDCARENPSQERRESWLACIALASYSLTRII